MWFCDSAGAGDDLPRWEQAAARGCIYTECALGAKQLLQGWLDLKQDPKTHLFSREVIWDQDYRVPKDVAGDVCEYPLARNLVLFSVALASEALVRFVLSGERENRSATLGDFAVRPTER